MTVYAEFLVCPLRALSLSRGGEIIEKILPLNCPWNLGGGCDGGRSEWSSSSVMTQRARFRVKHVMHNEPRNKTFFYDPRNGVCPDVLSRI